MVETDLPEIGSVRVPGQVKLPLKKKKNLSTNVCFLWICFGPELCR